jgi:hypothetical protein
MSTRLEPASFANAVLLESSDIPPDMTLAQWRREKQATAAAMSRTRRRRMMRVLRRNRTR